MQIQIEIDGQPQTIDVPDDASPEEIDGLVNELNAPKKPYDPMNDAPRLPGEEGYVAPGKPSERSILETIGKYVGDYLGGVKDAATAPTAAPGRQGGAVDNLVADLGDVPLLGPLYGAAESATTLATSAVAPALASVRGAVTGKEPTNADIADFTYSPRTAPGAALNRTAAAVAKPVADVAEATGADAALLPLAPELASVQTLPRVPKSKPAPAAPNMADPKTAARAAGYKLLPSEAGGGRVSQAMESLAGPQLKKDFRRSNEKATTKLAQEEIEAPSMDEKGFAKVREEGDAAYTAMEGIGRLQADEQVRSAVGKLSPRTGMRANSDIAKLQAQFEGLLDQPWDAGAVVNEVRQLRKEANANSAPPAMGAKPDPSKQSLAKAQIAVANALDDWLERNAQAIGQPEIAKNYRTARTRLAKTASVERATSGGKTDVRNLERQDERGVPHSGRLKVAAQTGEYFPESTGAVSGPDINVTPDSLFGSARQFLQSNLLRPVISAILRSEGFQNRLAPAPQSPLGWRDTGPTGPLAQYFEQRPETPYQPFAGEPAPAPLPRTSAESMRVANTLAGDLGLAPEGPMPDLPPAPSRLTAETPPPVRGDVRFTPSRPDTSAAGDLELAPDVSSGELPGGQAPRAAGMAGGVEGTTLFPELRAVRDTRDLASELGLFEEPSLTPEPFQGPLTLERGPEITNLDFPGYAPEQPATLPPNTIDFEPTLAQDLGLAQLQNRPSIANRRPALPPAQPTANDFMDLEAGNATPGVTGMLQDAGYVNEAGRITAAGRQARARLLGESEQPMAMQQQETLGDLIGAFSAQPSLRPGYSVLRGQGDAGVEVDNATLGSLFGDLGAEMTPIGAAPPKAARPLRTAQEYEATGGFQEKPAVVGAPQPAKKSKITSKTDPETGEIAIESPDGAVIVRKRGQYLRVNYAQVKPAARGKGKGLELYEQAVKDAEAAGLTLASDTKVSPEAARVYDALERRGYRVTRNEFEKDEDGQLVSTNSAKPIFIVQSPAAE